MPEEGACAAAVKRTRGETKGPREACTKQGRNGSDAGTDCVGHRGTQEWAPFANTVVWRRGSSKKTGRAKPSHLYQFQAHEGMTAAVVSRWGDTARVLGCKEGQCGEHRQCGASKRGDLTLAFLTCWQALAAGQEKREVRLTL